MEELLALVSKLGEKGFFQEALRGLIYASAIILFGSWKEIWTWKRDVVRELATLTARYEALLHQEREEKEWWRAVAMRATGIAELQGAATAALAKKSSEAP